MSEENQQQSPHQAPVPDVVNNPQGRQTEPTDILGIISIVMAFAGMQIVGIILGVIGMKKAKQEGYPVTLSKVGLILNIAFILVFIPLIVFFVFLAFASS